MKCNIIAKALLVLAIGASPAISFDVMAAQTKENQKKVKVVKKSTTSKKATKSNKKLVAKKSANKKTLAKSKKPTKIVKKKTNKKRYAKAASPTVTSASYAPRGIKYTVFNYVNGQVLEENHSDVVWPIASLTKLMTAYVFVNNTPNLKSCTSAITSEDRDLIKGTNTRLASYKPYSCETLLEVMLIASDNYAASALARSIPGWTKADFVKEMNFQAKQWGLHTTNFVDSSGLSPQNRSSVEDYRKLAMNVVKNDYISKISSEHSIIAENKWKRSIVYKNSNKLVREYGLDVNLSKTGYIRESGYNLVHLADCQQSIGVIEFGARSSEQRAAFVKQKLSKYGCA